MAYASQTGIGINNLQIGPLHTCHPLTGAIRPVTPSLLQESYLCPLPPELDFEGAFGIPGLPWAASFDVAPQDVIRLAVNTLVEIAKATPGLSVENLHLENVKGRARTHLEAIKQVWEALDDGLPEDLWVVRNALMSKADDCIESLPLLSDAPDPFRTPDEIGLVELLKSHHGLADHENAIQTRLKLDAPPPGTGALGYIQQNLLRFASPSEMDNSLSFFGLSNPFEEMEFAAALSQSYLDQCQVETPEQIGLLVPNNELYHNHLGHVFSEMGLALSGIAARHEERDLCGELLSALLAILQGPAPRLALATLYRSPLMPWDAALGHQMVRELMDIGRSKTANQQSGAASEVLSSLRPAKSPDQLLAKLGVIAKSLAPAEIRDDFQGRCQKIRSALAKCDGLDWAAVNQAVATRRSGEQVIDRYVEGISVFEETTIPWRTVRKMIVLGFSGRQWPRTPSASPFFTDSELAHVKNTAGLKIFSRKQRLDRNLEVFRRQLCAASDSIDFLVPARDAFGQRQQSSPGLSLLGRCLGAHKPEALIKDLRGTSQEQWPCRHRLLSPAPNQGRPDVPSDGQIRLETDLLKLRVDEKGRPATQSPSRLEKLIVSPLAWLMDELGARERIWGPEGVDPLVLGSVIHGVLERVFPQEQAVPTAGQIKKVLPFAMQDAILKEAAFLAGSGWSIERAGLLREAEKTCDAWADFLRVNDVSIVANEIGLSGTAFGLRLFGLADCILRTKQGQIVIVDHKRSGSARRRDQMRKGWDLQVALYAEMLANPDTEKAKEVVVPPGSYAATAYHLTLDHTVLLGGVGTPALQGAEPVNHDISANSLSYLTSKIEEVRTGLVRLNNEGDLERMEKERGSKPYALLDNMFVGSFLLTQSEPEEFPNV